MEEGVQNTVLQYQTLPRTTDPTTIHTHHDDSLSTSTAADDSALPQKTELLALVKAFFKDVAPLRCFGFIHESSYLQELDTVSSLEDDRRAVLCTICALATTTMYWQHLSHRGMLWAKHALSIITTDIERINVERVSCLVLLHEFYSRADKPAICFMVSSIACRICQALQLNVEHDLDFACDRSVLSAADKEARRRLMWACYAIDARAATGVESLKLVREENVTIQLPSHDDSFAYGIACPALYLSPLGDLRTSAALGMQQPTLNIRACFVQLIAMRDRILCYIKRAIPEVMPFDTGSDFTKLCSDLDDWLEHLPSNLLLTSETLHVRKGEGVLSALFDIHLTYGQCGCDLYRMMCPELLMPPRRSNSMTVDAPAEYLEAGRKKWFGFACTLSDHFELALRHVPDSMKEPGMAISAYTAIRTKLYYFLYCLPPQVHPAHAPEIYRRIEIDLRYLGALQSFHPNLARLRIYAEQLVRSLDPKGGGMTDRSGSAVDAGFSSSAGQIDCTRTTPVQISADQAMHPLTTFRMFRETVASRHRPEAQLFDALPSPGLGWLDMSPSADDQCTMPLIDAQTVPGPLLTDGIHSASNQECLDTTIAN